MISVIVPIYNVEQYLPKCLDSLAEQTISDVEFLLVDDGSTDRSGEIADQYTDPRFRVFHTENHGLSAARNLGIKEAGGEWLMFVDGDDWVVPDFCETPYKAAIRYDADLVIFKHQNSNIRSIISETEKNPVCILDTETALVSGGVVVWNKLYHRDLFDDIRFPEGRVYEDIATTHRLILAGKKIVMLPDILYFYNRRSGSISGNFSLKNKRDAFLAALERAEDLRSYKSAKLVNQKLLLSIAFTFLSVAEPSNDFIYQKAVEVVNAAESIPSNWSLRKKVMFLVWRLDQRLFHMICHAAGRRKQMRNPE